MSEDESSPLREAATNGSDSQPCVLLVEDDRSVRRYLEVTLQRSGYRVLTAEDGLQAMKVAMSSAIDLVVTDAVMPNLSGPQLAAFIRRNPKLSTIPIVLLTGHENKTALTTADGTIDAFLYKPVKADDLKNCVGKLVKSSRA